MRIILASQSPRRRELLAQMGLAERADFYQKCENRRVPDPE